MSKMTLFQLITQLADVYPNSPVTLDVCWHERRSGQRFLAIYVNYPPRYVCFEVNDQGIVDSIKLSSRSSPFYTEIASFDEAIGRLFDDGL